MSFIFLISEKSQIIVASLLNNIFSSKFFSCRVKALSHIILFACFKVSLNSQAILKNLRNSQWSYFSDFISVILNLSNLLILSHSTLMNSQIKSSELFSCMLSLLWHDLSSHADELNSDQIFMSFALQVCSNNIITFVHVACYRSSKIIERSFNLSFSFLLRFWWMFQSFSSALNQQSSSLHFSSQICSRQSTHLLI